MADVFISYARADRSRIRLIAQALMAEGFSVWWDPEIKPGKKWDDLIRRELEGAAAVVTCWTRASAQSKWVLAETSFADGQKKLAPAIVQSCVPPIPYNMVQSADLTRWRGNPDDLEWVALLGAVKTLVDARRKLAAVAPPPPGEAEAAQAAATAPVAATDIGYEAERYVPSQVRGRAKGFPVGRVLAGVGLTAALTMGVLASPDLMRQVEELTARPQVAATAPLPEPPLPPPAEPSPFDAAAPAEPLETAAIDPHTIEPPTTATPPVLTPPPAPPKPAPTPTPPPQRPAIGDHGAVKPVSVTPLTPAPDPRKPWTDLDTCAQTLAARCPATTARRPGFAQDGVITAQEGAFLREVGVETRVIDASVAQRCLAILPTATATVDASGAVTPLGKACGLKPTEQTLSPAAKAAIAAGASILLERALTNGRTTPSDPNGQRQPPPSTRPPPTTAPR